VQFDLERRSDLGRWAGVERVRALEFNFNSPYNDAGPGQAIPWVDYVTRIPESKQQYKTPTLRNVALGGPYMHNGRFATLEEVIEHYNDVGANRAPEDHGETVLNSIGLNTGEKRDLIAFLHSLTDQSRWSGPQAVIARNDVNSIEP